jgi:hypothetical protein
MAPRKRDSKASPRRSKPTSARKTARGSTKSPVKGHFVGRAGSPVLDRYPPKAMDAPVGVVVQVAGPPTPAQPKKGPAIDRPVPSPASAAPTASGPAAPSPTSSSPAAPKLLISLEKPFDIDDFSQLLGQTHIQVTVPRDSVAEVLRRACDFMGFGIYVYSIRVRPGPEELLKTFIVELQRVDFSAPAKDWVPFQDRGRADNPFGPTGTR